MFLYQNQKIFSEIIFLWGNHSFAQLKLSNGWSNAYVEKPF